MYSEHDYGGNPIIPRAPISLILGSIIAIIIMIFEDNTVRYRIEVLKCGDEIITAYNSKGDDITMSDNQNIYTYTIDGVTKHIQSYRCAYRWYYEGEQ